jgi:hypothetical protein
MTIGCLIGCRCPLPLLTAASQLCELQRSSRSHALKTRVHTAMKCRLLEAAFASSYDSFGEVVSLIPMLSRSYYSASAAEFVRTSPARASRQLHGREFPKGSRCWRHLDFKYTPRRAAAAADTSAAWVTAGSRRPSAEAGLEAPRAGGRQAE